MLLRRLRDQARAAGAESQGAPAGLARANCRGIRWREQRDQERRLLALVLKSNVEALLEQLRP